MAHNAMVAIFTFFHKRRLFQSTSLYNLDEFVMTALGWFKTPVSSQTQKLVAATKFSDYLGLKHYKKAKKLKHFIHLRLANQPQSLSTYHSISPAVNSGHCLKKYVPVM